jgi:hypothetical protein
MPYMPSLTTTLLVVATVAIFNFFLGSKDDNKRDNSSASPPRSTGTTSQSYPSSPPNPYSRGQTTTRTPATSDKRHDSYHSTRAPYHHTPSPDATRTHVFGYPESPPTHSRTLSSSSGSDLGTNSSTRRVLHSPRTVADILYGVGVKSAANDEDMKKVATELRDKARRSDREMRSAFDLAKTAQRRGDYRAEQRHRQDAIAYESERKSLDKRAAKIFFSENNKVRGHPSRCQYRAQPLSCHWQALTKGTVDLHDLHVAEAMEYAKKELQSALYRNDDEICFIVGTSFSHPCGICS